MTRALDYLAAALAIEVRQFNSPTNVDSIGKLRAIFERKYQVLTNEKHIDAAVRRLSSLGLIKIIEDPYAGTILRPLNVTSTTLQLIELSEMEGLEEFNKGLTGSHDLLPRAFSNEKFWNDLESEITSADAEFTADSGAPLVPASDRIVSISHNQYAAIDQPLSKLIEAVDRDNGLPEEPGFRERVLGHIKAGREFLRAGVFEARLFYMTMVVGLRMLADKYKAHAIGAMASQLLDLIVKQLGNLEL